MGRTDSKEPDYLELLEELEYDKKSFSRISSISTISLVATTALLTELATRYDYRMGQLPGSTDDVLLYSTSVAIGISGASAVMGAYFSNQASMQIDELEMSVDNRDEL